MSQSTANGIKVVIAGASVTVAGGSVAALSASTIIAATGGTAALLFAGYGLYRWLSKDQPEAEIIDERPQDKLPEAEKQLLE